MFSFGEGARIWVLAGAALAKLSWE
jgi:hypothetical protein